MWKLVCGLIAAGAMAASPAIAASLQVTPVSLQVPAPGATATLELTNEGKQPISAQIRVYSWTQKDGAERLEPTATVAASPPAAELAPGQRYTIRLVRLDSAPVAGEEAYRVVIDELPDQVQTRNGAINMVLRYSIPLFFFAPDASPPRVAWSAGKQNNRLSVLAANEGDRHLRISNMKLRDGAGTMVSFGPGLAGYVLGRSSNRFISKGATKGFASGSAKVIADSDLGHVDAPASIGK